MKKFLIFALSIFVLSNVFISCNDQKSLQELLREEKKAMDRFIALNGLVVVEEYPKGGVFRENEYFKTTDGLYIHVVDSGNSVRATAGKAVTVRYEYSLNILEAAKGDTSNMDRPNLLFPYSFTYGISATYNPTSSPVCMGWIIPLQYVTEDAYIDLIIPSSLGSYYDKNTVIPVFYKNLHYTSFN
jgi:hypothetical protein